MEIDAKVTHYELEKLWEQRQAALSREETSFAEWNEQTEEFHEAVADLIDHAMLKMMEDKAWLPYSMEIQEGTAVDFQVRVLFSDITAAIVTRRNQERKEVHAAVESVGKMVQEVEAHVEADVQETDVQEADAQAK